MKVIFTLAVAMLCTYASAQKDRAVLPKPWFSMTCNTDRGGPKHDTIPEDEIDAMLAAMAERGCCCVDVFKFADIWPFGSGHVYYNGSDSLEVSDALGSTGELIDSTISHLADYERSFAILHIDGNPDRHVIFRVHPGSMVHTGSEYHFGVDIIRQQGPAFTEGEWLCLKADHAGALNTTITQIQEGFIPIPGTHPGIPVTGPIEFDHYSVGDPDTMFYMWTDTPELYYCFSGFNGDIHHLVKGNGNYKQLSFENDPNGVYLTCQDSATAEGSQIQVKTDMIDLYKYSDNGYQTLFQVTDSIAYFTSSDITNLQGINYSGNIHDNFTDYTLIDKSYCDSISDDRIPYLASEQTELIFGEFEADSMGMILNSIGSSSHGQIGIDANTSELRVEDLSSFSYANVTASTVWLASISDTNYSWLTMNPYDMKVITPPGHAGVEYGMDLSPWYTDRSLIDKGYLDSIAGGIGIQACLLSNDTMYQNNVIHGEGFDLELLDFGSFNVECGSDAQMNVTDSDVLATFLADLNEISISFSENSSGELADIMMNETLIWSRVMNSTEGTTMRQDKDGMTISSNSASYYGITQDQAPPSYGSDPYQFVWMALITPWQGSGAPTFIPSDIPGRHYHNTATSPIEIYEATGTGLGTWVKLN